MFLSKPIAAQQRNNPQRAKTPRVRRFKVFLTGALGLLTATAAARGDITLLNQFANAGVGAENTPLLVTAGANGNVVVIDPFINQVAGNVYASDGSYQFSLTLVNGAAALSPGAGYGAFGS